MCTVRPETWQQWHGPAGGSTMFLSANEQVSVENLLHGIVTLSGNDASRRAGRVHRRDRAGLRQPDERAGQEAGLKNSRFGNSNGWPDEGCTYVTARDLATLARASIERHPKLYKQFYGQPSFTWGKTLGSGQAITQGNRNPILGKIAGADGLKTGHTEEAGYGFTGSAEQNGRRLVMVVAGLDSFNQRVAGIDAADELGLQRLAAKPLFGRARGRHGAGPARRRQRSRRWSPRATSRSPIPPGWRAGEPDEDRYQGPLKAPIAKGAAGRRADRHPPDGTAAAHAAGRWRGGREAGFFGRMWLGLKQLVSEWREPGAARPLHQPRRRGGGRQVDPAHALAARFGARGLDVVTTREPGGSEGAEAIRRCCWAARRIAGARRPKPCCSPPRAPTMSTRPSARRC
jgi:D-alanyl-D-alanine carboxypeptidase (penicillin-binding protein 5/6)